MLGSLRLSWMILQYIRQPVQIADAEEVQNVQG